MNRLASSILLVSALAMTACGGGGGGGPDGGGGGGGDGGGGGLTPASACSQYLSAMTTKLATCYASPADAVATALGNSNQCADLTAGVKAGRIKFDATKAQACLDLLKNAACADLGNTFNAPANNPCLEAFAGQVADGDPCYIGSDCSIHSSCSATAQQCPGTCVANVPLNGDCSAPGSRCDQGSCDGQTCQPDPVQGDACGGNTYVFCPTGLYCKGSSGSTPGTCQPQVADGSACDSQDACLLGDTCYSGTCAPTHGVGGTCTGDLDCGLLEYCDAGTCTLMPGSGGTCGSAGQSFIDCLNSYCKITDQTNYTGVCTDYVPVGGTCNPSDYSCASGSTCVGTTCTADCTEP